MYSLLHLTLIYLYKATNYQLQSPNTDMREMYYIIPLLAETYGDSIAVSLYSSRKAIVSLVLFVY